MKATVLIDRNEKKPLKFPKTLKWYRNRGAVAQLVIVSQALTTLPSGDYLLNGFEDRCIIERKGSIREIAGNLFTKDWARASDAFQRLADATEHPYLMLECTAAELRTKSRWVPEPERVQDALMALVERHGFGLLLCGRVNTAAQKRSVGELMLRLMLAHAYHQEEDYGEVGDVLKRLSRDI